MKLNRSQTAEQEIPLEAVAHELGKDALEDIRDRAAEVVRCEKQRRELLNKSELESLKARYHCSLEWRNELKEILRIAPLDGLRDLRYRRWYNWMIAVVLVVSGVFFAHLALAPFGLGWEAWAFSLGMGIVAAFWTDKTLEKINSESLIRAICVAALLSSLAGLLVMALLRGDILAVYLKTASASPFTGETTDLVSGAEFYRHAIWKLQLLMALLAVAMELGSGTALFEARRLDLTSHERAVAARKELQKLESEMVGLIGRITYLENEPAINEAEFYRNFYLGLLERMKRNGLVHLLLVGGLLLYLLPHGALAQAGNDVNRLDRPSGRPTNVVIALDLSKSVDTAGYDGKTDYKKSAEAACRLVSKLPPGARLTVLGITDQSFARPYVLLSRQIPKDRGPLLFQNRVEIAKTQIAAELREAIQSTDPSFPNTDILGTFIIAGEMFKESSEARKVLILFSDMRQATKEIDLEKPSAITVEDALRRVAKATLLTDLSGIEVYALGVHGVGKSVAYWNSLRDFWQAYFKKAGADLQTYSALREARDLFQGAGAGVH